MAVAGSATFKLIDPITEEHVGQTLIDFLPDGTSSSIARSKEAGVALQTTISPPLHTAAFMAALTRERTQIGHGTSGFPIVITPTVGVSLLVSIASCKTNNVQLS